MSDLAFNLNHRYIFVFIRQDLFSWEQLVHVAHAAFLMGKEVPRMIPLREMFEGIGTCLGHPSLVVIGVDNEEALKKVCDDLRAREVRFTAWKDPDAPEQGLLSVITEPVTKRDKNKLHHYRPWSERNNTHPKAQAQTPAESGWGICQTEAK